MEIRVLKKKWADSIFLVVLSILLLCILLFSFLIFNLSSITAKSRSYMAMTLKNSGDVRIEELQRFLTYIDLNSLNIQLKSQTVPFSRITSSMHSFSQLLYSYAEISSIVDDIFVCYTDLDIAIGAMGCYRPKDYYSLSHSLDKSQSNRYYWTLSHCNTGFHIFSRADGEDELLFVRRISYHNRDAGCIVVRISAEALLSNLSSEESDSVAFGIMFEDRLLQSEGNSSLLSTHEVISLASEYGGITYVAATSAEGSIRNLQIILFISAGILLFIICFGIISSLHLKIRHDRPIKEIGQKLGIGEDIFPISMINEKIEALIEEKNLSDERLNAQHFIVSSLFLNGVLSGQVKTDTEIVSYAKKCSLILDQPCFSIALIPLGNRSEDVHEYFRHNSTDILATNKDGELVLFIPLENDQTIDDANQIVKDLVSSCFSQDVYYSLSMIHDSLDTIADAYTEAKARLKRGDVYPQSYDISSLFLSLFDSGDYKGCIEYVDQLFDSLFSHTESAELRKVKFRGFEEHFLRFCPSFHLLYSSETELRSSLIGSLDILFCAADEGKEESTVARKAYEIIQKRFKDSQFGLFELAQELGVSNTYVSTQFKKYYGFGVASFISSLRMEEAKRLITSTDMSIKDIAVSVGFSSDIAFVRAFKKSESVTPGSLRK